MAHMKEDCCIGGSTRGSPNFWKLSVVRGLYMGLYQDDRGLHGRWSELGSPRYRQARM